MLRSKEVKEKSGDYLGEEGCRQTGSTVCKGPESGGILSPLQCHLPLFCLFFPLFQPGTGFFARMNTTLRSGKEGTKEAVQTNRNRGLLKLKGRPSS